MNHLGAFFRTLNQWLGIGSNPTSHGERWISALGALLGILAVYWASQWYLDASGMLLMVASMGASAVLLFAVPHGALSQPWSLVGGHLVSAFVGVSCQQLYPDHPLTPALAVALAVGSMHYLRCIHPPGGATALSAVIGGSEIHAMGYSYLLTPILLNAFCLLLVALIFNNLFAWRRYPGFLAQRAQPPAKSSTRIGPTHEDFAAAMQQLNSYLDVTAEDLAQLFELASQHAEQSANHPARIELGHYYSNGQIGSLWSVRQVIDQSSDGRKHKDRVIYKVVAGAGAFETGICRRDAFQQWARYEVVSRQGLWVRLDRATPVTAPVPLVAAGSADP